jgi:hypothetical protein
MTMPDRKFPWIWTAFALAFVVGFAVIEGWALATGGTTLSRYTYELSKDWPVLPWLIGVVQGGLAVHFWWHWTVPGEAGDGG